MTKQVFQDWRYQHADSKVFSVSQVAPSPKKVIHYKIPLSYILGNRMWQKHQQDKYLPIITNLYAIGNFIWRKTFVYDRDVKQAEYIWAHAQLVNWNVLLICLIWSTAPEKEPGNLDTYPHIYTCVVGCAMQV